MLKCGLVGLPNVGKSSLFNKLTSSFAQAENYPFCTVEAQTAHIIVPDERLQLLKESEQSLQVVPACIGLTDIAGLIEGASQGKGMGNLFLNDIRHVDVLLHVVRTFEDPNIFHVRGSIDPVKDLDTINTELVFADYQLVDRLCNKSSQFKEILANLLSWLSSGKLAYSFNASPEESKIMQGLNLMTSKPMIVLANKGSDLINSKVIKSSYELLAKQWASEHTLPFMELSILDDLDPKPLIQLIYHTMNQISYFTCGPKEVRAWSVEKNSPAPFAAKKIHSDFERKFIRAQVISYGDYLECGNIKNAIQKGKRRIEGKKYVVQDGDIIKFMI